MTKIPIKAIIFDLDGTLMYYTEGVIGFLDWIVIKTLEDLKMPVPGEEERVRLWRGKKSSNDVLRDWGIKDLDEFWKIFDEYQIVAVEKGIDKGELRLFDDVIPALDALKNEGFIIGMMTNTPPKITEVKLSKLKIKHYFKCIIAMGSERQEYAKPHPLGIIECMEKLGVSERESAYVGDEYFDILAAKNAKCYSVLIDRKNEKEFDENPDFKINSLLSLLDIFEVRKE